MSSKHLKKNNARVIQINSSDTLTAFTPMFWLCFSFRTATLHQADQHHFQIQRFWHKSGLYRSIQTAGWKLEKNGLTVNALSWRQPRIKQTTLMLFNRGFKPFQTNLVLSLYHSTPVWNISMVHVFMSYSWSFFIQNYNEREVSSTMESCLEKAVVMWELRTCSTYRNSFSYVKLKIMLHGDTAEVLVFYFSGKVLMLIHASIC